MNDEPTDIGKQKYPPDGTYVGDPCTCDEMCKQACDGIKLDGTWCHCIACCSCRNDAYDAQFYESDLG